MKNNRNYLMAVLTIVLIILAACGDSSVSDAKSNNESSDNSSTQNTNNDSFNVGLNDTDENTEIISEDTDNIETGEKDTSENKSTNSNDQKSSTPSKRDSEATGNNKEVYLQKLNEMEEADRYAEAKTTTSDMEEQEKERYKKWDVELNEIYNVLQEQLSTQQMDELREEQQNWVEHRDEAAKEASLEYEGGSTESLEYVATQASLTRERCYALVAKYMN